MGCGGEIVVDGLGWLCGRGTDVDGLALMGDGRDVDGGVDDVDVELAVAEDVTEVIDAVSVV